MKPPRALNEKSQCCGRKPIVYKRDRHFFCHRCSRSYDIDSKQQIPNWAWKAVEGGFEPTYPTHEYAQQ